LQDGGVLGCCSVPCMDMSPPPSAGVPKPVADVPM
jgi:hypothetical protein